MNNLNKIISIAVIALLIAGIGVGIALNWKTITKAFSTSKSTREQAAKELVGKPIQIQLEGRQVTIPAVLDEKTILHLKNKLPESGGMPLERARGGNALPFGIPL